VGILADGNWKLDLKGQSNVVKWTNRFAFAVRGLVVGIAVWGMVVGGAGCAGRSGLGGATTRGVDVGGGLRGVRVDGEGGRKGRTAGEVAALERIREEGMDRSQVMDTLDYMTNVIGPRLTGSPQLKRANEWTKGKLEGWGLANARLEQWGPFGRGWSLERFSMQVVSPDTIVLSGYPRAWSPSVNEEGVLEAGVVHVDTGTAGGAGEIDLEKYRGKLAGRVVLIGAVRQLDARFDPLATRVTEEELEKLAGAGLPGRGGGQGGLTNPTPRAAAMAGGVARGEVLPGQARGDTAGERRAAFGDTPAGRALARAAGGTATAPATTRSTTGGAGAGQGAVQRAFNFAVEEGAGLVVTASTRGDGGTLFVQGAMVAGGGAGGARTRPWAEDAKVGVAQVMLGAEDFNRLARMIARGVQPTIRVELKSKFHGEDLYAYNTIAEIPGTDLAGEVVMLGAHIDSWHSSTGTTDNGAGTATMMEAMRILQAAGIKPRRTIRIGLWSGEEQGLFGSAAFVKRHLGAMEGGGVAGGGATTQLGGGGATRPVRKLVKGEGWDRFSVYFNMDNGTGKLRGIYTQGNVAAVGVFGRWLAPVADLGAGTVTLSNTGSTDHVSFDAVGLPGFQFIQDSVEYFSRTWHSNQDSYDRAQVGDLKQAATVIATLAYQAAMSDEKFPRKPLPPGTVVEDGVAAVKVGR